MALARLGEQVQENSPMCKTIPTIIIGLIIAISITSCQRQQAGSFPNDERPQTIEFAPSPTAPMHVPLDTFDFLKALRLMFESPDMTFSENLGRDTVAVNNSMRWSTFSGWNPCKPIPSPSASTDKEQFECTKYILAESYYQNGAAKTLVLTETINGECHICTPQISGAVFLEQEGDWILDFKQLNFLSIGGWGQSPPATIIQIGENRFGILFRHHFAGTGISGEEIVIVTEMDELFKTVLVTDSALRNVEEGWGYDSEVVISEEAGRDWYDIQITTTGIRKSQVGARESFEETKWFAWDGGSYQIRTPN